MKSKVCDQIISFVILNFANLNEVAEFRAFLAAIESFLLRSSNGDSSKQIAKISAVATMILSRLPNHVQTLQDQGYEDRLMALDFILMMISDAEMKKKLHDFIPERLEDCQLNEVELEHLENFKKSLMGEN
jgi:hypothetical protein